jgi:DNA replication protein DnaC
MQSELITEKMNELHFFGMKRAFESTFKAGKQEKYTQDELVNYLLDAELDDRKTRKIDRAISLAKFRYKACIEDLIYDEQREIDKNLIMRFAECEFINRKENIIITGATGVGKSYVASALGNQACIAGYKAMYTNMAKLISKLKMVKADGSYLREITRMERVDLLVIDDFGLQPLDSQSSLSLLEIVEDRHEKRSTIITSQLPVEKWYEVIQEKTVADAILDRLVYSSHRMELKGESFRKRKNQKKEEKND